MLTYSFADQVHLTVLGERMYTHHVLCINYTTYDLQRSQDSINVHTHPDIMLLSEQGDNDGNNIHPFLYACVVKIFHVNVQDTCNPDSDSKQMDVLFVRWFCVDQSAPGGFATKRLHQLKFIPKSTDGDPFGFVDPADVLHACHIIPAFAHGQTDELLSPSLAHGEHAKLDRLLKENMDYRYYYVNM